ncbi:3'(2'),5'-bisphosphate nucleotidase CysQ [Bradyrhizobium sp.]|uniref:3'(2'),5'-bisphosphate nucleotidase CysQ n=1 Tax=Bradyrhizobium sp. TaxID=376 RepID=UPI002E18D522
MVPKYMDQTARNDIAIAFGSIAVEAGRAIMAVRGSQADVQHKPDGSPVTQADLDADRIICARLAGLLSGVPVVTEEACETHVFAGAGRFILVDPLDGTREFTSGRDEFTVNIALIDHGEPVAGAVYAPALNRLYLAGASAFRADVRPEDSVPGLHAMRALTTDAAPSDRLRAVASHSHLDPATKGWLDMRPIGELRSAGSSLKFCMIAEGEADVYPRLAPTMEWDTAAGHAVLAAAGGCVVRVDGLPLRYGKYEAGFRNESFIAWGTRHCCDSDRARAMLRNLN